MDGSISVPEAAERLGVSERTVRRRVRDGGIRAARIETPQGHTWRIDPASLPDSPGTPPGTPDKSLADATRHTGQEPGTGRQTADATRQEDDATRQAPDTPPGTPELMKALEMVDRLQRENQQLAGQLGFFQARVQDQEATIQRLLMAPKDEPAPAEERVAPAEPAPLRPWWRRLFSG